MVKRLVAERGCAIRVRTIERAVADMRRAQRVAAMATVRMETAPTRSATASRIDWSAITSRSSWRRLRMRYVAERLEAPLMIQGESYRLRQKKKAGLLSRASPNDG